MSIKILPAYNLLNEISTLFTEYTGMIINQQPDYKEYLDLQNYDEEVKDASIKYAQPHGRLYIAYFENELAGCLGLKKINDNHAELKRFFVRPKYRKKHIGSKMLDLIISDAKQIGYSHIYLNTFPFLEDAIRMYKSKGFYEISSYNNSPMDSLLYLKLDL